MRQAVNGAVGQTGSKYGSCAHIGIRLERFARHTRGGNTGPCCGYLARAASFFGVG